MQESFLHFVWQYQYFNRQDLSTAEGEPLLVLKQGVYNRQDAGPDFKGSRLRLGNMDWYGDVEIHLKASDWERHNHQHDPAYNSVVLHVVWEDDAPIYRQDGTAIPVLVLKDRVEPSLLGEYGGLMQSPLSIPCSPRFEQVDDLYKFSMLDASLLQRLRRKSEEILGWVEMAGGDWETVAWWLLARNFGFKKNNESFLALAQRLPLKVLAKHRDQPLQQEALLFGMAGFLEDSTDSEDSYIARLQQEWEFLGKKYQLTGKQLRRHEWKFLRMRPANFPTVRLAQLAAVLREQYHLFSAFRDTPDAKTLMKLLRNPQTDYWKEHYDIRKASKSKIPAMGALAAENLLINTTAPLLVAYGQYSDEESWTERALELLQQLTAENNFIIREWEVLGLKARHAFDSQALIELYNEYCLKKRCLQCTVGLQLLKRRNT